MKKVFGIIFIIVGATSSTIAMIALLTETDLEPQVASRLVSQLFTSPGIFGLGLWMLLSAISKKKRDVVNQNKNSINN